MRKEIKQALTIMIAVILLSSTVSALKSMNKMSRELKNHFFTGDEFNLSIHGDLDRKTSIAGNLVSLAKYYLPESEPHLKTISETIKSMTNEDSVSKLYKLNSTLDENVLYTIATLEKASLTDSHRKMLTNYTSDYKSKMTTIANDNYNTLVKEYYDETGGFPGFIFQLFADSPEYFK